VSLRFNIEENTIIEAFVRFRFARVANTSELRSFPPSSLTNIRVGDVGMQLGSSHYSHSQSIELIDKNSLHEFVCTFYAAVERPDPKGFSTF
jgi:hypothetical protein